MGILKNFRQSVTSVEVETPSIPTVISQNQPLLEEKSAELEISRELSGTQEHVPKDMNEALQVKAIEEQAYAQGWTEEQLWQSSKRYDLRGLVHFLRPGQQITNITRQFIQLSWEDAQGQERSTRFYNHRVEQPWLRP